MRDIFVRGRPSQRGLYLLTWGLIYAVLTLIFIMEPDPILTGRDPVRILFGAASLAALVAAWEHRLDAVAFGLLAGSSILRGLLYVNPELPLTGGFRAAVVTLWIGVGTAQLVVARWPMATKRNGDAVIRLDGQ